MPGVRPCSAITPVQSWGVTDLLLASFSSSENHSPPPAPDFIVPEWDSGLGTISSPSDDFSVKPGCAHGLDRSQPPPPPGDTLA